MEDGFRRHIDARAQAERKRGTDPAECVPAEVDLVVQWRNETPQSLIGAVTATNVSHRAWRITGKPRVILVAADGHVLNRRHIVNLKRRVQDWTVVQPQESVSAAVSVSRWDGVELANYFMIKWPGGTKAASVRGPTHPAKRERGPMYTSSSWFEPLTPSA